MADWIYLGYGSCKDMSIVQEVRTEGGDIWMIEHSGKERVFKATAEASRAVDDWAEAKCGDDKPDIEYHWIKDGDLPDYYRLCWLGYAEYGGVREYVTVGKYCLISTVDWADISGEKMPTPDWWVDLGEQVAWPIDNHL